MVDSTHTHTLEQIKVLYYILFPIRNKIIIIKYYGTLNILIDECSYNTSYDPDRNVLNCEDLCHLVNYQPMKTHK